MTRHNPYVESELENCQKWARKALALQEQQATEIERLNALWTCEHETVLRLIAERDSARHDRDNYREACINIENERDALAKRWEAIKAHVFGVDDDACAPPVDEWDAGWTEAFADVRSKMRELEDQR